MEELKQTVLTGDIWQCLELFGVDTIWGWSCSSTQWVEASDGVKHPIKCRTAPIIKNYPTPKINSQRLKT